MRFSWKRHGQALSFQTRTVCTLLSHTTLTCKVTDRQTRQRLDYAAKATSVSLYPPPPHQFITLTTPIIPSPSDSIRICISWVSHHCKSLVTKRISNHNESLCNNLFQINSSIQFPISWEATDYLISVSFCF